MPLHLRPLIALACCAVLAGGEAGPDDVRAFELPDAFLRVRLHDAPRLVQRFQDGAYGRLVASPTGQLLQGQLEVVLKREGQQLATLTGLLEQIRAAGLSLQVNEERYDYDPTLQLALATIDLEASFALLGRLGPLPPVDEANPALRLLDRRTAMQAFGNTLVLRHHRASPTAFVQNLEPPADVASEADLEARFVIKPIADGFRRWLDAQDDDRRRWTRDEEFVFRLLDGLDLTGTATFTDAGVRERFSCAMTGTLAEIRDIGAARPKVAKEILTQLPGETLAAVAWSQGLEVLAVIFREAGLVYARDRDRLPDKEFFIGTGIFEAFDGPGMAWLELVDGQVVITVMQHMKPATGALMTLVMKELGREVLRELGRELPEASRPLVLGRVPLDEAEQAVHSAYVDGLLVATTHPKGVAAATGRAGGFALLPEVKAGYEALPEEAVILGLSNSKASWGAVGEIVAKMTAAELEVPLFNTLAADLRGAAVRGWLWADVTADGQAFVIENEGLLGWTTGLGTFVGAFAWWLF